MINKANLTDIYRTLKKITGNAHVFQVHIKNYQN